jgi:transposase
LPGFAAQPSASRRGSPRYRSGSASTLRLLGDGRDEHLGDAPLQWRFFRTARPTYSCRTCDKIVGAPASAKVIARSKDSFATLTTAGSIVIAPSIASQG